MRLRERPALKEIIEIVTSLYQLAKGHKKAVLLFVIFELWVHSLAFRHLSELKSIYQLIPFLN